MLSRLAQGLVLLATVAPAQPAFETAPASFAAPVAAHPLSFEQITEKNLQRPDGTAAKETTKRKGFRDSRGRTRIESDPAGSVIRITDPVAGSFITLDTKSKTAYRAPFAGGAVFPKITPAPDQGMKARNLGKRTIEGIEFEGTRVEQTLDDGRMPPVMREC